MAMLTPRSAVVRRRDWRRALARLIFLTTWGMALRPIEVQRDGGIRRQEAERPGGRESEAEEAADRGGRSRQGARIMPLSASVCGNWPRSADGSAIADNLLPGADQPQIRPLRYDVIRVFLLPGRPDRPRLGNKKSAKYL